MFVVWEKWMETETDGYIDPSSSSIISALFPHLGSGCSTVCHWGHKALSLQAGSPFGIPLQLTRTVWAPGYIIVFRPPASTVLPLIYTGVSLDWRVRQGSIYDTLSSPQLSYNDSLWAWGISKIHREQGLDCREADELSWCPSLSNSLWKGWSCGLAHCLGGNATGPIWRVLASSDGISSWTPLKPQNSYPTPNPNTLAYQLWCIDFLTSSTPLIIPPRFPVIVNTWTKKSKKFWMSRVSIFHRQIDEISLMDTLVWLRNRNSDWETEYQLIAVQSKAIRIMTCCSDTATQSIIKIR